MELILKEMKKVAVTIGLMAAVLLTAGAFWDVDWQKLLLSLLFGGLYTLANFMLLGTVCAKACRKPPQKAKTYMQLHYALRLLLTGVVILASFQMPYLVPVGVIVPLFAPKLTYLAAGIWQSVWQRKRRKKEEAADRY